MQNGGTQTECGHKNEMSIECITFSSFGQANVKQVKSKGKCYEQKDRKQMEAHAAKGAFTDIFAQERIAGVRGFLHDTARCRRTGYLYGQGKGTAQYSR